jgi:maltose alpha-D-glucosyltransferase / alpha-amylase
MKVVGTTNNAPLRLPSTDLNDDPLWHKDAIIYELHVRAFNDANGDGIGDMAGIVDKLDYLADLGVTAIWLLPFYPSPLRDGGYDIADYTNIHESYGTRRDFTRLLREAHRRGIRIITELVLNHTSNEHPWFQRARNAPAGSKLRDFYVWNDTPERYEDARIIFKDFETSNWAWDGVAKSYFWHRFYAHQPDLNFDNPAVHDALLEVVDFWMDMGVDGLRLDAVPYLYERDGTSCENLPETHAFLKKLRAHVDGKYKNRILLAEANQWPSDAASYFGAGDECHMNFHFPLMPRMFMGIELEDSFPIVDILQRTPQQPEGCQWATFLRNHDELTLEMVTDEDRDTMWRAYASERTARINLGIRRRLAPLLKTRRKIELMTSLLLALPGTPVLYYGDEIGMGDNIYLGDRDGVRTPMQWSSDRNAGFSRANPQRLYLPPVVDPEFHYEAINVEAQQQNPSSLLWWTKRLIAKRKEHQVFGRGSIEFPHADNARVLVFVREHEGESILIVANLSRFVQCVEIELGRFEGKVPREVFGRARFPTIGTAPYFLSMAPHTFLWLSLELPREKVTTPHEPPTLAVGKTWRAIFEPAMRAELARVLLSYIVERRWFRSKARERKGAHVLDVIGREATGAAYAVVLLSVDYEEGSPETYVVPLAFAEANEEIEAGAVVARLSVVPAGGAPELGVLYDALVGAPFAESLLQLMRGRRTLAGERGQLVGTSFSALQRVAPEASLAPRAGTAEQSNSNVVYGDSFILKVFRSTEEGPNPELEIGRFLKETGFRHTAKIAGALEYRRTGGEPSTVGVLFEHVANRGDAWRMTLDALDRFFDRVLSGESPTPPPPVAGSLVERASVAASPALRDAIGPYLDRARLLGARTAELHLALASSTKDADFAPEPFDGMHQQSLYQAAHNLAARTWRLLKKHQKDQAEPNELVERLLGAEAAVDAAFVKVSTRKMSVARIRVHGDYHLGQVLWTGEDFVIIDFEGEPGRPLSHRRFKRCPLRDVAGMIRSFHYAAAAALRSGRPRQEDLGLLEEWTRHWTARVSAELLAGYLERAAGAAFVPRTDEDLMTLLDFYLLEKCVYEVAYELNNRPDWLDIPARGLFGLLEEPA